MAFYINFLKKGKGGEKDALLLDVQESGQDENSQQLLQILGLVC